MENEPDSAQSPALWETLGEEQVADCRVFRVMKSRERNPRSGDEGDFYTIDAPDWVVVLASPEAGRYLMVRQYRFGARRLSWEFPAGCIDPGETPAAAAERELLEETGYRAVGKPSPLGSFHPNPALQGNRCHVFLFDKILPTGQSHPDPFEEIELRTMELGKIEQMAAEGEIIHALAHAALFLLRRAGK